MFIYDLILVVEPFSINVLNRDLAADCPLYVEFPAIKGIFYIILV